MSVTNPDDDAYRVETPARGMSAPTSVLPTAMIGRYRVVGVIGAGAMGAVVRAHDDRLGRDVAIKRVKNLHGLVAASFHARFEAEARALAALAHPGVVQIFDLGIDGDEPYLVMELLEGPSLKEELATRGPRPAAEVAAIGIQLARALEAAHGRRILHRDVKPGNVVRAADGRWKLVDFGVAHMPDSDVTITGQFLGTPAYAAPEALALGQFSAASDVYGLAATLLEIATGGRPRGDLTMTELLVATGPVLDDAAIARLGPLGPVLAAGLALAPAARPSATDLAEQLAGTASSPSMSMPAAATAASSSTALATAALPPLPIAAARDLRRWLLAGAALVLLIGLFALADRAGSDGASRPSAGPRAAPMQPTDQPLVFDPPPDLDDKGMRDWGKIGDKIRKGEYDEALDKLRELERKRGTSAETARLRAWLEGHEH